MPHRGKLTSGPVNLKHLLHEFPILMSVALMVGLLFIRAAPCHDGLGEGDIASAAICLIR